MSKMKAGVVYGMNDIRYDDIEKPQAGPGKVLIKVKYTGICGSDVPRVNGDACHFFPNVLGHEFSGTVEEAGEGVTSLKPGDRVAGVPLVPCMECEDCQKGNYSLCKHYSFIGSREFGSFAEYVVVPEKNAVKFDDSVSFEQGAFFEPATVALHGLQRCDYTGGKTVAVLGGGTIGMMTMQWAKIFGAREVVVFDIVEERLELGRRLGATACINTLEEGFMDKAMALTGGRGFDYVYETAGNTITMKMAFKLAASGGYYISAQADKIFATEETVTGSIGVIMSGLNYSGLLEKLGVEDTTVKSGALKDMGSGTRPETKEEEAVLQAYIDSAYSRFVAIVSEGRNKSEEEVKKIADGRIYDGVQAKEVGLVDELGFPEDALKAMRKEQQLEDAEDRKSVV